jgi:hypothetical protein
MISQKNIQLARKIGLAMRRARIAKEETLANLSSILIKLKILKKKKTIE